MISLTKTSLAQHAVNVITQDDFYTHIFCPVFCDEDQSFPSKSFPVSVMVEYITSLQSFNLSIHFFLYELLVNTLVKCGDLFRLHQFLQYHVLSDSKHLACLLLSIQGVYPAAHQIALDMLKRLGTAHDQIVEVFLSNHQVFYKSLLIHNHNRAISCCLDMISNVYQSQEKWSQQVSAGSLSMIAKYVTSLF